ncbi:MAG: dihydropteroate synthase [Alphaproteobacteria bacterium]|nr:dihydropteroate synthase [Alphaproteobacteria bacterium]
MTSYIAVGSNLGNRKSNIINAYKLLQKKGYSILEVSPLYETPAALLYKNAQDDWNKPYLNCIFKLETKNSPFKILSDLKDIEFTLKRSAHEKWSPRTIDLDIIEHNDVQIRTSNLTIPHSLYLERSFVLDPLSWFKQISKKYLYKKSHQPLIMGIINATPNSFSENEFSIKKCKQKISHWIKNSIQIIDIGAEASNPDVNPIDEETEQNRLIEIFKHISKQKNILSFTKFSIDTYHYKTAELALYHNFDIINDIHGFNDKNMLSLAKEHPNKNFIFMHNEDIRQLPLKDTLPNIENWLKKKLDTFSKTNLNLNHFIFDPGIGFGKTKNQSLLILQHIEEFQKYGLRILIGHSRKSFMETFSSKKPEKRDLETIAISLSICDKIDVLRVHSPIEHQQALKASNHMFNQFF